LGGNITHAPKKKKKRKKERRNEWRKLSTKKNLTLDIIHLNWTHLLHPFLVTMTQERFVLLVGDQRDRFRVAAIPNSNLGLHPGWAGYRFQIQRQL
jgi:hypothetical protein